MNLTVHKRKTTGSPAARRDRKSGKVPGVVYGRGFDSINVEVDAHELELFLKKRQGGARLLDITIKNGNGETTEKGIIKKIEYDPVSDRPSHLDIHRVDLTRTVDITVPIRLQGQSECPGIKMGGLLEFHRTQLNIRCLPTDIPDGVNVFVAKLNIGDSVYIRDLALPPNVQVLDAVDTVAVSLVEPQLEEVKVEAATVPVEGAAPAEGVAAPAEGAAAAPAAKGVAAAPAAKGAAKEAKPAEDKAKKK